MTDRDAELKTALFEAHERPHRTANWDDVLLRARRGRFPRWAATRLAPSFAVALVGALLVVLFIRVGDDPSTQPASDFAIHLLNVPQTSEDNAHGTLGSPLPNGILPSSLRLMVRLEHPRRTYFVGRTPDNAVCLLAVVGTLRGVSCTSAELMGSIRVATISSELGTGVETVGLVDDRITQARIVGGEPVDVRDNVFALQGVNTNSIEVLDSGIWRQTNATTSASNAVALFSKPQTADDRLPPSFGSMLSGDPSLQPLAGNSRLALDQDGVKLWIGGDGSIACVFAAPAEHACGAWEQVALGGGLIFEPTIRTGGAVPGGSTWRHYLVGIVQDGFDIATIGSRSTPIRNGVFSFAARPIGTEVVIRGRAGERHITLGLDARIHTALPDADLSTLHPILEVADRRRGEAARLVVAARRGGGQCRWVEVEFSYQTGDCRPAPRYAAGHAGAFLTNVQNAAQTPFRNASGYRMFLVGDAGDGVASIELQLSDGRTIAAQVTAGSFMALFDLNIQQTKPTIFRTLDASGGELWSRDERGRGDNLSEDSVVGDMKTQPLP